jgi:hypothetical protein
MVDQSGAVRARIVKERVVRFWVGEIAGVVREKIERPKGVI